MKLCLTWKAQGLARVEIRNRRSLDKLYRHKPGAVRGLQLSLQNLLRLVGRREEITVEPLEVAINLLFLDDCFDAINRGGVALGGEPRAALTVQAFEFKVAVVERVDEVRRGSAGHAAAHGPVIQKDDRFTLTREQVSGRHPRDPGPDDANICAHIFRERRLWRHAGGVHPDGSSLTGIVLHCYSLLSADTLYGAGLVPLFRRGVSLRLDRDPVHVNHLAAEPAGDRD